NKIILDPMTFSEARFRPSLEERLESIISGAALMADSSCTRDDRRERIVAECNAVRQALQDLLSEYMNNSKSSNGLNLYIAPIHFIVGIEEAMLQIPPSLTVLQCKLACFGLSRV
ncbi:hypothetical protein STEG23_009830, partial [Scotinomys teguina]